MSALCGRCSRRSARRLCRSDGFREVDVSASKTCLVRFDRNRYSIGAKAANRPVQLRAYADRVVVRFDGEVVATHERVFGRDRVRYNPLHYLPVLARKPGALRNGAPFKDWELPPNLTKLRARLGRSDEADRQFVGILAAIPEDGLDAVEEACRLALSEGLCSRDAVLNILSWGRDSAPPKSCENDSLTSVLLLPRQRSKVRSGTAPGQTRRDRRRTGVRASAP